MIYFIKLNVVSILYALLIFLPIELMVNIYRISRITRWNIDTVNILSGVIIVVGLIFGTMVQLFFTKRWMKGRKANFWTIVFWIPYLVLFVYIIASLFPTTYGGDVPNPGTGILVIGALIIFPIYILIINLIGYKNEDRTSITT